MNHEKQNDAARPENGENARKKRVARARRSAEKRRGDAPARNRHILFLAVDIVLLAAIVAAVLFIVSLLTPLSLFGGSRETVREVTYTVELAGLDSTSVAALHTGDVLTDAETGAEIGTVTNVDIRAYEVYTDVPSAEKDAALDSYVVTKLTYPEGFNTVTVTVTVNAAYEEGVGYSADGCRIAVGRTYRIKFPGCTGQGVCIACVAQ